MKQSEQYDIVYKFVVTLYAVFMVYLAVEWFTK